MLSGTVPASGSLFWSAGAANEGQAAFTWDDTKFSFSPALAAVPAGGDGWLISALPHRDKVVPEAIFDAILCILALPAGICFFVLGTLSGSKESDAKEPKAGQ